MLKKTISLHALLKYSIAHKRDMKPPPIPDFKNVNDFGLPKVIILATIHLTKCDILLHSGVIRPPMSPKQGFSYGNLQTAH